MRTNIACNGTVIVAEIFFVNTLDLIDYVAGFLRIYCIILKRWQQDNISIVQHYSIIYQGAPRMSLCR